MPNSAGNGSACHQVTGDQQRTSRSFARSLCMSGFEFWLAIDQNEYITIRLYQLK
jgi:hypothetical protein